MIANCILVAFVISNLLFVKDGKSALLSLAKTLKNDFFILVDSNLKIHDFFDSRYLYEV